MINPDSSATILPFIVFVVIIIISPLIHFVFFAQSKYLVCEFCYILVCTASVLLDNGHKILTCDAKPVINGVVALNLMQFFVVKFSRTDINLPYSVTKLKAVAGIGGKGRGVKL